MKRTSCDHKGKPKALLDGRIDQSDEKRDDAERKEEVPMNAVLTDVFLLQAVRLARKFTQK